MGARQSESAGAWQSETNLSAGARQGETNLGAGARQGESAGARQGETNLSAGARQSETNLSAGARQSEAWGELLQSIGAVHARVCSLYVLQKRGTLLETLATNLIVALLYLRT